LQGQATFEDKCIIQYRMWQINSNTREQTNGEISVFAIFHLSIAFIYSAQLSFKSVKINVAGNIRPITDMKNIDYCAVLRTAGFFPVFGSLISRTNETTNGAIPACPFYVSPKKKEFS
jgi:hypothetical protein